MKKCKNCKGTIQNRGNDTKYASKRKFCSRKCNIIYNTKSHRDEYGINNGMKKCYKCKGIFPSSAFYINNRTHDGFSYLHMKCQKDNAEYIRLKTVHSIIGHYSDGRFVCACCGKNSNLGIDHIGGNGKDHRKMLSRSAIGQTTFYFWLINNNFPDGYQVLCHKCNARKNIYDNCNCKELRQKYPQFAKIL